MQIGRASDVRDLRVRGDDGRKAVGSESVTRMVRGICPRFSGGEPMCLLHLAQLATLSLQNIPKYCTRAML